MKLIKKTKSRCPYCLKIIDANVVEEKDGVWMYKKCDEHGPSKGFIDKDIELYKKMMNDLGEETPFKQVVVPITHKCNLKCKFCFVPERGLREKTTDEIKDEIRKLMSGPKNTKGICFSGGEPTLREDLFELIDFMEKEYPSKMKLIMTNGLRLEDPKYVKSIKESRAGVVFSLNSFKENIYKYINQRNLLDIKIRALKNLKEFSVPTVLSPTVFRGLNEEDLKSIIQYAIDNLDFVYEVRVRGGAKVGKHGENTPLSYSELFDLVAKSLGKDRKFFLNSFSKNDCYHSVQQFLITLVIDNSPDKKDILGFNYDPYSKPTLSNKIKKIYIILKILFRRGLKNFLQAFIKSKIINFRIGKIEIRGTSLLYENLNIKLLKLKMWWWSDRTNIDLEEIKAIGVTHTTYDGRELIFHDAIIVANEL